GFPGLGGGYASVPGRDDQARQSDSGPLYGAPSPYPQGEIEHREVYHPVPPSEGQEKSSASEWMDHPIMRNPYRPFGMIIPGFAAMIILGIFGVPIPFGLGLGWYSGMALTDPKLNQTQKTVRIGVAAAIVVFLSIMTYVIIKPI